MELKRHRHYFISPIATSWEKANIHAIHNYSHTLAHPFKMCKSFLTTKISLGSPPNVPHFVQSSFQALLKHPNHVVTFDIDVYKSTAQRHQTSIFSDWSASADKVIHSVFTIPTNVTRKLTRSGCTTFCCTNCLCSCQHFTWDCGSPRDHNLSRSCWTSHKYPTFFWIFSAKKVIGPATASYDLFMNTWTVFQLPYNTARHILFSLIFHISSGILALEELWLLAMLVNTLQVSFTLLYVV
jgi:hypothetical protein